MTSSLFKRKLSVDFRHLNHYVFILLYLGTIAGNQPLLLGPVRLSMVFVTPAVIISASHFYTEFPFKRARLPLVFLVFLGTLCIAIYSRQHLRLFAELFSYIVLCYSGAYMFVHHRNKLFFQIFFLVLISLLFCLSQASGLGRWSHIHTVLEDNNPSIWLNEHGERSFYNFFRLADLYDYSHKVWSDLSAHVQNTLAFTDSIQTVSTLQYRPAGVFPTNTSLSFLLLVAFVLIFRQKGLTAYLLIPPLCLLLVISMAKIAFVGFTLLIFYSLLFDRQKNIFQNAVYIVSTIIFLLLYRHFFPIFIERNQSFKVIYTSFYSRFVSLVGQLPADSPVYSFFNTYFELESKKDVFLVSDVNSSYMLLVRYSALIAIVLLPAAFLYIRSVRHAKKQMSDPNSLKICFSMLFVLILYLGAVPFHTAKVFWYFFGMALVPVLIYTRVVECVPYRKVKHEFIATNGKIDTL